MGGGGGGGIWMPLLSGFRFLGDSKGPPLYYFEIFILKTENKNFLKAPSAPIYTNF